MITSDLREGIVWLTVEGELTFEDVQHEVSQWVAQKNRFSGFITDLRGMGGVPPMGELQKMEAWREQNRSGKPHAVLGQTNALSALLTIYVRLTQARDTRYFMDADAAIEWVKGFELSAR